MDVKCRVEMMLSSISIKTFLPLLMLLAVYGVATSTELCDQIPEAKELHVESETPVLCWNLTCPILMLRICAKFGGQEAYKNGLCPPGFNPFLTISNQGSQFLGNHWNAKHYRAFKIFHFIGNLSTGDSSFSVNVTGNQDIFVGNNTFLALARFEGEARATCHRNLTVYHLLLKGHDKSSSPPPVPSKQGKAVTGHDESISTPPTPNKAKIVTGYYHGIIAVFVIMFLVLEVLSLVIIGMCYLQHQEEVHF